MNFVNAPAVYYKEYIYVPAAAESTGYTSRLSAVIAYGNGMFMVGNNYTGTTGAIQTSVDGIIWTAPMVLHQNAGNIVDIKFVEATGVFYILHYSSGGYRLYTTTDGIAIPAAAGLTFVTGEQIRTGTLAVNDAGTVLLNPYRTYTSSTGTYYGYVHSSTNSGSSWTSTFIQYTEPRYVTHHNDVWIMIHTSSIAVANTTQKGYPRVVKSTNNGVTWTALPNFPNYSGVNAIYYGRPMFVNGLWFISSMDETGAESYVYTSPDAISWTKRPSPLFIHAMAYNNGFWIIYSYGGTWAHSTDLTTWVTQSCTAIPNTGIEMTTAYGAGRFVTVNGSYSPTILSI